MKWWTKTIDSVTFFTNEYYNDNFCSHCIDIPVEKEEMDLVIWWNNNSTIYDSKNYKSNCFCPMYWCMWSIHKWNKYKALRRKRK